MEKELNPYHPGAGMAPRVLAARSEDIEAFETLIARVKLSSPVRPIIFSGLHGSGKTVLLNRVRSLAEHHNFRVVQFAGRPGATGSQAARRELAAGFVRIAARYSSQAAMDTVKRMLGSVSSFSMSLGIEGVALGIERDVTRASSGLIDLDLQDTIEDISLVLRNERSALMIFIDEMQELDGEILGALLTAQHFALQRELPFFVIGAGLPNLPAKLTVSRSYAERLFEYRGIGKLSMR